MYILPDNILWYIWQYIGVKSYFLDKLLITIIAEKRQVFHTKPLRIHYELWRIKKKHCHVGYTSIGRPSMYCEKVKYIDISCGLIGKIYANNCIHLSEKITDKIIPLSEISPNDFNMKLIYWQIKQAWCDDKRLSFYISLWPDFRHQAPLEIF